MRAGIVVNVRRADRLRLEAIVADRSAPQKQVWRAKVILATADGCGTAEIMRRSGKSKPVVGTWQARFMAEDVEGLLRDKTRKPGKPPLPPHHRSAGGRSGLELLSAIMWMIHEAELHSPARRARRCRSFIESSYYRHGVGDYWKGLAN
jgi:Winged helix-turn helix